MSITPSSSENEKSLTTLDTLKKLALAATPGPWKWTFEDSSLMALYGPRELEDHVLWSQICKSCAKRGARCTAPSDADAAFIEAVNPKAILDLIEKHKRLKEACDIFEKNSADAVELDEKNRRLNKIIATFVAAFEKASEERYSFNEERQAEARKWKDQNDMYGWNFHQGMASGATWVDLIYAKAFRELKEALEKEMIQKK